ncbi:hypothetical protein Tsubulata_015463 [Turnera subulata]|uniref:Uncharacterized protein n=1 Tax=Turnera subulata TaxID=218843 RepID=A0A9Q0FD69_9ROSI|nr:hypothetical protein Tsubulata_015463 [Turnera subulata]
MCWPYCCSLRWEVSAIASPSSTSKYCVLPTLSLLEVGSWVLTFSGGLWRGWSWNQ